jgi:predicted phage tail protein
LARKGIIGYKGGGGGGGNEDPNTLRSSEYARVLDLLSEGEIGGLVNGLQSIYLDDTPLQATDGSWNFSNVRVDVRTGTADQAYIAGFPEAENEVTVGQKVSAQTPLVRTITNPETNAVRLTVSVPALTSTDTGTGDIHGSSVSYHVELSNGGGPFVPMPVGSSWSNAVTGMHQYQWQAPSAAYGIGVALGWDGNGNVSYQLDYRLVGTTEWVTYTTETINKSDLDIQLTYEANSGNASAGMSSSGSQSALLQMKKSARVIDIPLVNGQYEVRLTKTGGNGDIYIYGGRVPGTSNTDTISGKTTAKYERSFYMPLTGQAPWSIRLVRDTPDNVKSNVTNDLYWDSYTEVIEAKLRYPLSAIVGLRVDATQFSSIPRRSYHIYGIKVKVPSNYDPASRGYNGTWDGTFKVAWTDNPAWIFYDLATNKRYGLGNYIDETHIDKWQLYSIAAYCDQLVPTGFLDEAGNKTYEPRFTCNCYLQQEEDAWKVLADLAAVFRGMVYWGVGSVSLNQDAPQDVFWQFNQSNVVNGNFEYSGTARNARHTVALVQWNDPLNMYNQAYEYVQDDDGVARLGYNKTDVVAFGCTSRGQAHRVGKWILYSEIYETETVSFDTGLEGVPLRPGHVIQIADQVRAGARRGGRVLSGSTTSAINIDQPLNLDAGKTYTLSLMSGGSLVTRNISNPAGSTNVLHVNQALPTAPEADAVWVVSEPALEPQLFRVLNVKENTSEGTYTVTALEYNASKFGAIEDGLTLEVPKTSIVPATAAQPINLRVDESTYFLAPGVLGVKLHFSWSASSPLYNVKWRRSDDGHVSNWTEVQVQSPQFDLEPVAEDGQYDFAVSAVTTQGQVSPESDITYKVLGTTNPPGPPTNLTAKGDFRSVILNWANPSSIDLDHIEIWESSRDDVSTAVMVGTAHGTQYVRTGLPGLTTRWYWIKAVNMRGMASQFNSNEGTVATTTQATHDDMVQQFIDNSLLAPTLLSEITANSGAAAQLLSYFDQQSQASADIASLKQAVAVLQNFVNTGKSDTTQFVTQETLLNVQNELVQAAVDQINGVYNGPSGVIAQQITNLKTAVDQQFASIQVTAQTLNGLSAQYTIKVDANGAIAGIGLASTTANGVPDSEVTIVADRFAIVAPNSQGAAEAQYPFIIQTINGIPMISMNSAFITEVTAALLHSPDNKFRIDLNNKLISIEV